MTSCATTAWSSASATTWAPIDGCTVLASLKAAATTAQRLNIAVKADGVPALVVDLLDKLEDSGPHPFKLSDAEDGLWPVMAERAKILTEAPRFSHVVIGATVKMAMMQTISPATFVEFKRWLAERPNWEPFKRRRAAGANRARAHGRGLAAGALSPSPFAEDWTVVIRGRSLLAQWEHGGRHARGVRGSSRRGGERVLLQWCEVSLVFRFCLICEFR
jgi:Nucleotidyltransferase